MYFTANSELIKKKAEQKHYVFRIDDLPQVEWIDVINCLNYNVCSNNTVQTLDNFGIVLLDIKTLIKIKEVYLDFCKIEPKIDCSAHLYISLTSQSKTFGWHKDTSDVIFWQVLGKTLFSVLENGRIYEYELSTNDLIFIPKGMKHCTKPLTPRAGISLGIDYASIKQ